MVGTGSGPTVLWADRRSREPIGHATVDYLYSLYDAWSASMSPATRPGRSSMRWNGTHHTHQRLVILRQDGENRFAMLAGDRALRGPDGRWPVRRFRSQDDAEEMDGFRGGREGSTAFAARWRRFESIARSLAAFAARWEGIRVGPQGDGRIPRRGQPEFGLVAEMGDFGRGHPGIQAGAQGDG